MVRLKIRHNYIIVALLALVLVFGICGLYYFYNSVPKTVCSLDSNGNKITKTQALKIEAENNNSGIQCQSNSNCAFDKEFGAINPSKYVKYHCRTEGQSNLLTEYLHFSIPICLQNTCQLIKEDNVDHELCKKFVDENASSHHIAGCYNKLALVQNNISICDIPKDSNARNECHAWIDA